MIYMLIAAEKNIRVPRRTEEYIDGYFDAVTVAFSAMRAYPGCFLTAKKN